MSHSLVVLPRRIVPLLRIRFSAEEGREALTYNKSRRLYFKSPSSKMIIWEIK